MAEETDVLRTHDEWNAVSSAPPERMTLDQYRAAEAAHTCANQQQMYRELGAKLDAVLRETTVARIKVEELDGAVERLELHMARHFDYPLSQVYMTDLEELRGRLRGVADRAFLEKVEAILGDDVRAALGELAGDPALRAKVEEVAEQVHAAVAELAAEYHTIREAEEAQRAEQRRQAEIQQETVRQAAALLAQQVAGVGEASSPAQG